MAQAIALYTFTFCDPGCSEEICTVYLFINVIVSTLFVGYEDMLSEESTDVTLQHTLCYSELTDNMEITGISWNATGAVVAARYDT